ncbi:hypothetical protein [Helicobacter trogontum]|uniref:Uncharacterized protein n=1 Tax=Helicobacter trogontum TaxID=50960 RepID=A0A4U8THE5_9HELI|nr:hypothetical protein [Helicobacter trogontum]MCI5785926.1 hypothetical protein [Helicobacter trogontum]MDY5184900.1 hypothetical protein [Helicobacter trogontum]TLD99114.1 hypothetical protein LS80_002590 [Helicobacter trogontum]
MKFLLSQCYRDNTRINHSIIVLQQDAINIALHECYRSLSYANYEFHAATLQSHSTLQYDIYVVLRRYLQS